MRVILAFGLVSFFADMTYEGARAITGPYLASLGSSASAVAFIAGLGELIGFGLRYFSGILADRTRAYWLLAGLGYGVNVAAVPMMAFAESWEVVAALVVLERTGKSLRAPARDVMLSKAAESVGSGWGFGLHAAMDQAGALTGPLIVAGVFATTAEYRAAFAWLAAPAALAMLALAYARWSYREPAKVEAPAVLAAEPAVYPRQFWIHVIASGLLAAGYFDFALAGYHLKKGNETAVPVLYAAAMAANALGAVVIGRLFDRFGGIVIPASIVFSALAAPCLFLDGPPWVAVSLWGIGLGMMDSAMRAGVAKIVPMQKRGRAYGIFNGVFGLSWFAGSAVMGWLYGKSMGGAVAWCLAFQGAAAWMFWRQTGKKPDMQ